MIKFHFLKLHSNFCKERIFNSLIHHSMTIMFYTNIRHSKQTVSENTVVLDILKIYYLHMKEGT